MNDLCQSNFEVLLTQVLILSIQIGMSDLQIINDNIEAIFYLINSALDPCYFITENITYSNVEQLTVSTNSIVTNIVKIYFNSKDITNYLSMIIINSNYNDLLYLFSSLSEFI